VSSTLFARARRQRRPEDHGRDRDPALFQRQPGRELSRAILGHPVLPAAMALGTLCGGWRIVRTMGSRITHLTPMQGWCAETGGAATLFTATWLGVPVSTTHTITGDIIGVGSVRRLSAVRWGVAGDIVIAWLVTMPAAALVGAVFYLLTRLM